MYHLPMKAIDWEKYKFKLRSLPNYKTMPRYFHSAMLFLALLAVYNFISICLFYDDFMPRLPAPFIIAIPLIFIHVYTSIESEYKNVTRETVSEAVVHIRLKRLQSLKEMLEENPEILNGKYKKKSLLYWARHHKNFQAHALIISELKKGALLK